MTTYGVSAIASGFVRMWRGWTVIVPVVIVNALLLALLIWPDPIPGQSALPIVLALLDAVVFLIAYGLISATALHVADGKVGWPQALAVLRGNAARYAIWAVGLAVVAIIGRAFYTLPGLLVLALTPFLLLAALDGQANPLAANFRTIGRRFWRWLVTVVIAGLVLAIGSISSGLFTFFTRTPLATLVVWLVAGLVLAWFTTAWALIYRSAHAEPHEAQAQAQEPDRAPVPADVTPDAGNGEAEAG